MTGCWDVTGADDFLPVLIYVVIHANPPQLASNLEYIQRFRMHSRMVSESAYFFTQLVSTQYTSCLKVAQQKHVWRNCSKEFTSLLDSTRVWQTGSLLASLHSVINTYAVAIFDTCLQICECSVLYFAAASCNSCRTLSI